MGSDPRTPAEAPVAATPADAIPPAAGFPVLPDLPEGPGAPRAVGVELEFGALAPERAADIAGRTLGGRVSAVSAAEWRLEGARIDDAPVGEVKIYLDTALRPEGRDRAAVAGVALARQIVPIEIVTPPLPQTALPALERLVDALRDAGAEGSRSHLLHGFGLHLNVTLADPEHGADLPRIARAFALLEPWLRLRDPLDLARRALPFTQPFPEPFVDALAALPDGDAADLFDLLDTHITSRNHGLDLLPAYAALAPRRFADHPGASGAVSARPAYHYRMGESRVDEPAWSLGYEWRRWWLVERVGADAGLTGRLASAWIAARAAPFRTDHAGYAAAVTAALGPLAIHAPEGGAPSRGGDET